MSPIAIETLFRVFSRRWSHKFEKTFTDPKARDVWRADLSGLDITEQDIETGLHRSAPLTWPPSPAEFAKLCKPSPEDLGLPSVNQAYRDATHCKWTHPVVYETAKRVGVYELRNHSEARTKADFEREFAEVCAEWMAGKRFEQPKAERLELKPTPWVPKTPEEAKRRCDALRQVIGPMPEPLKPEPAPAPINDEDVEALRAQQLEALADASTRYRSAS